MHKQMKHSVKFDLVLLRLCFVILFCSHAFPNLFQLNQPKDGYFKFLVIIIMVLLKGSENVQNVVIFICSFYYDYSF